MKKNSNVVVGTPVYPIAPNPTPTPNSNAVSSNKEEDPLKAIAEKHTPSETSKSEDKD
jgi:hypothetical protein